MAARKLSRTGSDPDRTIAELRARVEALEHRFFLTADGDFLIIDRASDVCSLWTDETSEIESWIEERERPTVPVTETKTEDSDRKPTELNELLSALYGVQALVRVLFEQFGSGVKILEEGDVSGLVQLLDRETSRAVGIAETASP